MYISFAVGDRCRIHSACSFNDTKGTVVRRDEHVSSVRLDGHEEAVHFGNPALHSEFQPSPLGSRSNP